MYGDWVLRPAAFLESRQSNDRNPNKSEMEQQHITVLVRLSCRWEALVPVMVPSLWSVTLREIKAAFSPVRFDFNETDGR